MEGVKFVYIVRSFQIVGGGEIVGGAKDKGARGSGAWSTKDTGLAAWPSGLSLVPNHKPLVTDLGGVLRPHPHPTPAPKSLTAVTVQKRFRNSHLEIGFSGSSHYSVVEETNTTKNHEAVRSIPGLDSVG